MDMVSVSLQLGFSFPDFLLPCFFFYVSPHAQMYNQNKMYMDDFVVLLQPNTAK